MSHNGWIAVDLDGTLAFYAGNHAEIGAPIMPMVERVRHWLAAGKEVRIFTARVFAHGRETSTHVEAQHELIAAWCKEWFGRVLPITCSKDPGMIELWDDRAIQVVKNTGEPVLGKRARRM